MKIRTIVALAGITAACATQFVLHTHRYALVIIICISIGILMISNDNIGNKGPKVKA